MAPKLKIVFTGSLLVFAILACQSSSNPVPGSTAEPTKPIEILPTEEFFMSTNVPEAVNEGGPELPNFLAGTDTVCAVHLLDRALSCLNQDGWQVYNFDFLPLIAPCPDGRMYLYMEDRFYLYEDKILLKTIDPGDTINYAESLSCGPGNELWLTSGGWVKHFDGTTWTEYWAVKFLGYAGYDLNKEIVIAPNGDPWVTTNESIATMNGTDWQVFGKGKGFEEDIHVLDLAIDSDGNVWSLSQGCLEPTNCNVGDPIYSKFLPGRLLKYDGTGWTIIPFPDGFYADFIREDHEGRIWISGGDATIPVFYTYDPQADQWSLQASEEGQVNRLIKNMQIDPQGRLWLATDYGLDVYDGSNWLTYRMDTADLYSNKIDEIMVLGNVSQLPAPAPKAPGSVRGRLVDPDSKTSYAGLQVEICLRSTVWHITGHTPCANQVYHALTTMDADGNFLFTDIPVGKYYLVIEVSPDVWGSTVTSSPWGTSLNAEFEVYPGTETLLGEIKSSLDEK